MMEVVRFFLGIDVGNSRIKFGLFDRSRAEVASNGLALCVHSLAVRMSEPIPWDRIVGWVEGLADEWRAAVAGANPEGVDRLVSQWPAKLGASPEHIRDVTRFPIRIRVDEPGKVGVDRVLNAVAANVLRRPGQAAIIVDSGTATTVDFVDGEGAFRGGAILPGLRLAARSLHEYTALLPLVTMDELRQEPVPIVGRNTNEAIRSGIFWGQLGAVRELIGRMERAAAETSRKAAPTERSEPRPSLPASDLPEPVRPLLLLTGGGGLLLSREIPQGRLEPHLSLQGLAIVAAHGTKG
ncbi:MAG: type III pantothenate kinase [Planctomycetes bacterium]|nr:type III pantothenate kinase [Planctomycetota bacterium]